MTQIDLQNAIIKNFFLKKLFLLKTKVSYSRGTKPFGFTSQNMNKDLDQDSLLKGTKVSQLEVK